MSPKDPSKKKLSNVVGIFLIGGSVVFGPRILDFLSNDLFPLTNNVSVGPNYLGESAEVPVSKCFYKIQTAGGALSIVKSHLLVSGVWVPAVRVFSQNPFLFHSKQINELSSNPCEVPNRNLTDITMPTDGKVDFPDTYFGDDTCGLVLKFFQLPEGSVYSFEAVDYMGNPVFNGGILGTNVSSDICN